MCQSQHSQLLDGKTEAQGWECARVTILTFWVGKLRHEAPGREGGCAGDALGSGPALDGWIWVDGSMLVLQFVISMVIQEGLLADLSFRNLCGSPSWGFSSFWVAREAQGRVIPGGGGAVGWDFAPWKLPGPAGHCLPFHEFLAPALKAAQMFLPAQHLQLLCARCFLGPDVDGPLASRPHIPLERGTSAWKKGMDW